MAAQKLTSRQVSEMRRIYADPDSALTYADLAAEYDVSEASVRYHLADLAKPSHQRGPARKICLQRVAELRHWGVKPTDIARVFCVSRQSVYRAIRKARAAA